VAEAKPPSVTPATPVAAPPAAGGAQAASLPVSPSAPAADVCLLVEGTYPYVPGGVSSWVHDIILGHPDLRFSVLNVGSHPGSYGEPRYKLPDNVVALHKVFCHDETPPPLDGSARAELTEHIRLVRARADARQQPPRVLSAFRRIHLDEEATPELLADLASGDLTIPEFLHGRATFELLTELSERLAPDAPFLDLFWHFRAMHVPLMRVLATPAPPSACYHAVSTGYAGLLGAVWSHRTGRPLVVTEHGIYARERDMELSRAEWIRDHHRGPAEEGEAAWTWAPRVSPLRRMWSRFFRTLSRIAYQQATRIVTLSEVNRRKQLDDGAPAHKIEIVPNGVLLKTDVEVGRALDGAALRDDRTASSFSPPSLSSTPSLSSLSPSFGDDIIPLRGPKLRVGFVGRVVPIKDVVTFIKACDLALRVVEIDVRIIGPAEEDPDYAGRCRALVEQLGRQEQIRFVGPKPPSEIYTDLDLIALTSFSEGQPLVMLEAYAAELPVIATDVGACREMIEGRTEEDRRLGPSGIVCSVASPKQTAAALILMAKEPRLRRRMGIAGRKRVTAYYQRRTMLASYRALYGSMVTS
jgi:glycosyltransferase involved in cell wall biosynthesis